LPAALSVSDFMEAIKGASSHYINHLPGQPDCLYWQPGYGLLTDVTQTLMSAMC
jgi:putative transposase